MSQFTKSTSHYKAQYVNLGASAVLGPTGRILTASSPDESASNAATVKLALMQLNAGSKFDLLPDTGANILAGCLRVKTGGSIFADFLEITVIFDDIF